MQVIYKITGEIVLSFESFLVLCCFIIQLFQIQSNKVLPEYDLAFLEKKIISEIWKCYF